MLIFLVPLLRYALFAFCGDTSHVANRLDPEFVTELSGAEKNLAEAAAEGDQTKDATFITS